jgi:hypothetical protein
LNDEDHRDHCRDGVASNPLTALLCPPTNLDLLALLLLGSATVGVGLD